MIAFTISSRNFYGYTQTLHDTFRHFHPEVPFYAILADEPTDLDTDAFPFQILSPDDLSVPDFEAMSERYNITELNTALKPFAFLSLFDLHPGETVLYLDPDILVVSRFAELLDLLKSGVECVLTPHITEPAEYAEFGDQQALRYGINNLGFWHSSRHSGGAARRLVVGTTTRVPLHHRPRQRPVRRPEVGRLASGVHRALCPLASPRVRRRLLEPCSASGVASRGLLARQRSPAAVRTLQRKQDRGGGRVFARHSTQFEVHNIGALRALLDDYRARVTGRGHGYFKAIPYAFGWLGRAA